MATLFGFVFVAREICPILHLFGRRYSLRMKAVFLVFTLAWAAMTVEAGEPPESQSAAGPQTPVTQETINKLLAVIAAHEARIQALESELEKKLEDSGSGVPA